MARIGGRNRAVAVPVGLASVALVAALVWLGMPAFQVIGEWFGSGAPTLQQMPPASESPSPPAPEQIEP